jgi:hypothetical protein
MIQYREMRQSALPPQYRFKENMKITETSRVLVFLEV